MAHYNFRPKRYKLITVDRPLAQTAVKAVGEFVEREIYRAEFVKNKSQILKACNTRVKILGIIHESKGKLKTSVYGPYEGTKKGFFGEIKFNRIINYLTIFNKFMNFKFDGWKYKRLIADFKSKPYAVIRRFKRSRIYTWLYSKCKFTLKELKRFRTLRRKISGVVTGNPTFVNEHGKKVPIRWSSGNDPLSDPQHNNSQTLVTFCNFYFKV